MYRHCRLLISVLERVVSGKLNRVMVCMPPRHGKSELISRIFPAYYLARYPGRFVGLASYSFDLAGVLSRAARENYIRAGFDTAEDAGAVKHWETRAGGGMWSAGVGGGITGRGFSLGIIDDPIKDAEEAASQTIREKIKDWWSSTFSTRAEPNASIILVQTRWHEDDLAGALLAAELRSNSKERWHIVSLPALYEPAHHLLFPEGCSIEPDFRTVENEPLCPERYNAETLLHKRANMSGYHFEALYQQRPTSPTGILFDVTKLEYIDHPPADPASRCRAWDKASSEGSGDYTAGVRMSRTRDGLFIVEEVQRGQWGTAKRDRLINYIADIDGRTVRIIGEQEPGSAGKDSAGAFVRMLSGFPVKIEKVSGSKEIRADPFSSQVNAGNVRLVRGEWNADFVEELRQFPRGKHDDQVDAASLAFNHLNKRQEWRVSEFRF